MIFGWFVSIAGGYSQSKSIGSYNGGSGCQGTGGTIPGFDVVETTAEAVGAPSVIVAPMTFQ